MGIPAKYAHVEASDAPRTIKEAVAIYGTREAPGAANNPVIMEWAREVKRALRKTDLGYTADSVPWCGLFAAVVCVRAGWTDQIPATPLWARAWLEFGRPADKPSFGDILVFGRKGGGHVAFYVGEDAEAYHVIGGNQSDAVTITRVAKNRFLGARRPKWKRSQPASVRPIRMGASGPLSKNEA